MNMGEKLKRDGAPIVLFGLIVSGKIYSLWIYLSSSENLWDLLRNIDQVEQYGQGAVYFLTNELSYILYFIVATAFDALVFYSFIVRSEAKSRPTGITENLLPLVTVFVPVIGYTLLFLPQIRPLVPGYSPETLAAMKAITPLFGFYVNMAAFTLGLLGAAFSIWSILYLKRSFGLRAAVRQLVTSGPYARIRHPLYLGEIIHIFGIAILSGKPIGLYLFVVALAMQIIRAKVEERKFLRTLSEYKDYMQQTGFLWPRLRRA